MTKSEENFVVPQKVLSRDLLGLHKTFSGTKKKFENKTFKLIFSLQNF